MKLFTQLLLTFALMSAVTLRAEAQIQSLSELKSNTKYLLKNANGFGYCVHRTNDDQYSWLEYATLRGATTIHTQGCYDARYMEEIDTKDTDNLWYIKSDGNGAYHFVNAGSNKYLTNRLTYEDWGDYSYDYESFFMYETKSALEITEIRTGVYAIRAAGSTDQMMYMCAATQEQYPIATWSIDDLGSEWLIIDAAKGETDDPDTPEEPEEPDDPEEPVIPVEDEYTEENLGPSTFFFLTDSTMLAFPDSFVVSREDDGQYICLTMEGDTTFTIAKSHVLRETREYDGILPVFESFKFNDKFNDQLTEDAIGEIDNDSNRIDLKAAVIGKRLIPSFKTPDRTRVYAKGEQQYSKHSSMRFDKDIAYTLANEGEFIYKVVKVKDEEWYVPQPGDTAYWLKEKVDLQADWLSTNAPSNYGEDVEYIIDGNINTFFHSTWGSGTYTKLTWSEGAYYGDGQSEWPYIQINLPEAEHRLCLSYTTRDSADRYPRGFILQGSTNGSAWNDIRQFTLEADNLPTGTSEEWTSPVITIADNYPFLRLQLTEACHKNYFVISEFSLFRIIENPNRDTTQQDSILVHPAEYKGTLQPYGRRYRVHVDFPTDRSTTKYNVPVIRINTIDGTMIDSKNRYWDASFEIDGAGIWDDMLIDVIQIKGRGNSSWSNSAYSKNPYRLKFPEKYKPFGLKNGKNWVLLANKQSESMTSNAIAMKIADMVETAGCNHIIPVELYINGNYRGSYQFTEKIGFGNNSIDLEDETYATMLELDTYYDETYKFTTKSYSLCVNVKEPEFDDPECETGLTLDNIKTSFQQFTTSVKEDGEDYTQYLDIDKFCRVMLVTDLTRNCEFKHPKSWFLYNENIMADSLWVFGPVWDFDWAFGYDGSSVYYRYSARSDLFSDNTYSNRGIPFFQTLLRGSEAVKKSYYRLWTRFLDEGRMDQLLDYIDDYYEFANPSFEHNSTSWGDGKNYATVTERSKEWLTERAEYIYENLDVYPLEDDDIFTPDEDQELPNRIDLVKEFTRPVDVYNTSGMMVRHAVAIGEALRGLPSGIYIMGGHKYIVK